MLYLKRIGAGLPGRIAVKLESFGEAPLYPWTVSQELPLMLESKLSSMPTIVEPLGSVKERTALAMIEELELQGKLTPGKSTLLEVTSGNTGVLYAPATY